MDVGYSQYGACVVHRIPRRGRRSRRGPPRRSRRRRAQGPARSLLRFLFVYVLV